MILDWLASSGLAAVKPWLAVLALPPVPLLALALAGAWRARAQPRLGRLLVALACIGLWLAASTGAARRVEHALLAEPPALTASDRALLKSRAGAGEPLAIVVLGGGVDTLATEYGTELPGTTSMARLHYGAWLARETGIALATSGGRGWAAHGVEAPAEAALMASVARDHFGVPARWIEARSRDTHENAANTLPLLKADGIGEVLVVTNGWHMPRAMREFEAAAAAAGAPRVRIRAAPMGESWPEMSRAMAWTPSGEGALRMRAVLREALASLFDGR